MSKRDDDSSSDMEVGMTTAERRRRRRRGGGLRVPSDNVPRRTTTPPVVAPVPEDPSLAMSIAYSFTSDASEPVARVTVETPVPSFDAIAPDAMPTVIDSVSGPVEEASFEMKTREMSAVDLQALGLEEPGTRKATKPPVSEMDVEVTLDTDVPGPAAVAAPAPAPPPSPTPPPITRRAGTEPGAATSLASRLENAGKQIQQDQQQDAPRPRERLKTMALSDEDLEEVREAYRAATTKPAEPATAQHVNDEKSEPLSVPEIDINELAERADSSGEFEVDVEDVPIKPAIVAHDKPIVQAAPPTPPATPATGDRRSRPPSAPPPVAPSAAITSPGGAVSQSNPAMQAPSASTSGSHAPPPPPPAHKTPPAPPPKAPAKPPAAAVAAVAPAKPIEPIKPAAPRGKPWFVDLFDEDYLRTLPFLTPQATQSEAEFVIDAMGLQPGAQVLDVGCGYGRHAMELAARGFHVVGLDLSTPLLVRGGEEAQRRGLEINFVRGDMRELDFENQFDGAYCLFSTFGYFDDETNKKTITNISRALKPGGRVMIEILNRDYVIADLPTRVWWEGDGCVVLEEVELNYFSSRIQVNRSVVFDDGRQLEQEISVRAYSLHEIGKLMHAAGFRVLEVSGGYHTRGRFFGNQSRHIIVLAERKDPSAA